MFISCVSNLHDVNVGSSIFTLKSFDFSQGLCKVKIHPIFYLLVFSEHILLTSTALRLATGFNSSQDNQGCNHLITT